MDSGIIRIGWREWATLPDLGINRIKAKIDTGAKTSALHAFDMKTFTEHGVDRIWFALHPFQRRTDIVKECVADIHDQRWVSDSGGHREKRYVILSTIAMGDMEWPVEITLTNRDNMKFRMLLGRTAMKNRFMIDPSASYVLGKYQLKVRDKEGRQP